MKVEWLILADAAQVIGGKLYLLGGGWDRLTVNSEFPVEQRLAVAASFLVDWNETNERQPVVIEVTDADNSSLLRLGAEIEVGRPPGIPAGQPQRAQLAAEVGMKFEAPGIYVVSARVSDQERTELSFYVVPGPFVAKRPRPEDGAA